MFGFGFVLEFEFGQVLIAVDAELGRIADIKDGVFVMTKYHWIGTLCPQECDPSQFLQLYIYDTENKVANRLRHFGGSGSVSMDPKIVQSLISLLDKHDELVQLFQTARDRCEGQQGSDSKIRLYIVVGAREYDWSSSHTLGAIVFETAHEPKLITMSSLKRRMDFLRESINIKRFMEQYPDLTATDRADAVPAVQILEVHLEHWQSISCRARLPLRSIVSNDGRKKTTLTEWLEYNDANEDGRHLTYLYFIKGFVWYGDLKTWRPRKRGQGLIGRLAHVHPSAGELFYLRMLLCHQKGRSFEEIHTFNHRMYSTFWVACEALGLLGDDKEWNTALEEASFTSSAAELRSLFAQILIYCEVLNPVKLWNKIKSASYIKSDDIPLTTSKVLCIQNLYMNDPKLQGGVLFELEIILDNYLKTITNFGLPALSRRLQAKLKNRALMEEKSYNRVELSQEDESPMNDRRCFKTLNRTLSDILDILDTLFGDYFASWLLDIGDGNIGEPAEDDNQSSSWIRIPEKPTVRELQQKAIMCPRNDTANIIKSKILEMIIRDNTIYKSSDDAIPLGNDRGKVELLYPIE
ncbi:hypothetical protein Tco_1336506 [Tanacetum coccineum]